MTYNEGKEHIDKLSHRKEEAKLIKASINIA